ncbi:50S ribosomal protein L29 [Cyanobium sp. T1B-Tous]|jgi:large subunit ribosomal protein L29|uniref:50S ribosomal protein L29 n=1 Tax=unclassified Cyanobium TaxID=2627006 RepID=UPI0016813684|nr:MULTISPECIES: 50S ribosomal protein L29 [unclassified Cyanobium]MBD2422397.1 50S ribosomal protein L29 [Cyanobium sp. FACHB-13342]MCP9805607.1 50S ribosomal protein L29 [Cyanobium sp. T1B-Tous]MCX6870871.1 50S ribosomal protein L29 [Verrucomicrobiota bacterium]
MARPNIADVRKLSGDQINEQVNATRRELFELRFQQATRRLENPHRFKEARIKLAHLLTVQKEQLRSAATADSAS